MSSEKMEEKGTGFKRTETNEAKAAFLDGDES